MKAITTLLVACLLTIAVSAQSVSTGVAFNKGTQPALMLLLPYAENIAEGTILQKLRENGYDPETKGKLFMKQNKINGFYTFKGVVLKELDKQPLDLYFKVETRGKKESETAAIYFVVSKGEEKFITPETDQELHSAAKKFLDKFIEASAAYKLQKDIETQEEQVQEADKKLAKIKDSEKDQQEKLAQLQEEIKQNKLQQENQAKILEKEKAKLAELKAKVVKK